MHVKICGITRPDDGIASVAAGAHAIGLVFFAGSRRAVTVPQAREICEQMPPLANIVGLFVNPTEAEVAQVLAEVPLNMLQFHGDETASFCQQFDRPWMKALPAAPHDTLVTRMAGYGAGCRGILLDSAAPGQYGGTGHTFDWSALPAEFPVPVVLAGGLDPANVADAVRMVRPSAVDVSSGVESAPGIKDKYRIQEFVANAMAAAQECAI